MFSLSPVKILLVVAVVMILLGPDKLPEVANRLGRTWRALKHLQERVEAEVRSAVPDLPSTAEIARIARSPVNLLNQLAERAGAADDPPDTAAAAPSDPPVPSPTAEAEAPGASPPRPAPPPDDRPFADPALN